MFSFDLQRWRNAPVIEFALALTTFVSVIFVVRLERPVKGPPREVGEVMIELSQLGDLICCESVTTRG